MGSKGTKSNQSSSKESTTPNGGPSDAWVEPVGVLPAFEKQYVGGPICPAPAPAPSPGPQGPPSAATRQIFNALSITNDGKVSSHFFLTVLQRSGLQPRTE